MINRIKHIAEVSKKSVICEGNEIASRCFAPAKFRRTTRIYFRALQFLSVSSGRV